jgi:hypothetical protein
MQESEFQKHILAAFDGDDIVKMKGAAMRKIIDLTGQRFGRLVVIERAENIGNVPRWRCICDCGNESVVRGACLRNMNTQSCGCLNTEKRRERKTTHGYSSNRIHKVWRGINDRCYNPNRTGFSNYGGRGISVCSEWRNDFTTFYQWAIESGYSDELTIDRIDNNEGYSPQNCRWVSIHQQMANTRRNTDFPGVNKQKKVGYMACLCINGEFVLRKWFMYKEDAIEARLNAERKFGIVIKRRTT